MAALPVDTAYIAGVFSYIRAGLRNGHNTFRFSWYLEEGDFINAFATEFKDMPMPWIGVLGTNPENRTIEVVFLGVGEAHP